MKIDENNTAYIAKIRLVDVTTVAFSTVSTYGAMRIR
jgi:hypothetical protein